jgi:hypothetical protein
LPGWGNRQLRLRRSIRNSNFDYKGAFIGVGSGAGSEYTVHEVWSAMNWEIHLTETRMILWSPEVSRLFGKSVVKPGRSTVSIITYGSIGSVLVVANETGQFNVNIMAKLSTKDTLFSYINTLQKACENGGS